MTSSSGGYANVDEAKVTTRNATLIKDVFRDIPGVYVSGTSGFHQKIYMRGVSDRGLNISIDGAKQTGYNFHHNSDLLIDPDLIKAVDIEVGARSVVNGSGALGGSVAFKTVDASDLLEDGQDIGAKIKMGYTSNNKGYSQSAMVYGRALDSLDLLAAFKHYGYNFGKSGNNHRVGGDGNDINYLFKASYSFLDAHKISLSTEHMQYKGLYPFRANFGIDYSSGNVIADRKYERDTHTIKYTYNPSDLLELDVTGYYTDHTLHSKIGSADKIGVETVGSKIGAKTKFNTGDFAHTLRYGFDFYRSESYAKPTNLTPEKLNNYALYLEDAIKFGDLTVTPGIRYERHELKTYNGTAGNLKTYKYKFDAVSPAIALDYEIGKGFGAFASYARIFKGPDLMEGMLASGTYITGRGTQYTDWVGNDNLKKTTGNAYEIGGRYKGEFAERSSISLIAKYFRTEYKNLIMDTNAARGRINSTVTRRNAGNVDIDGVEIFSRLNLDTLSLAAGYTHQKVKYKDRVASNAAGTSFYSSTYLGYRDLGDKYTFNAEYTIPQADLLLGYNLIYFAKKNAMSASSNSIVKLPSYAVSDVYVTYMPDSSRFKGLEINAGLYNVFNKAYASQTQQSEDFATGNAEWEPGRNFKVSVSYKF
ncbi:TonB-dependent receptor domain-containing protein [Campylobacter curvus]|uniref:TonB-dependent receptor n=1 Tax=Campylobacter curvus (strain 525.92) TaxID=360105 RepID=A7GWU0_CAMC5|nr:TonB-dependent receptor [Campylobacter curvus]EAU00999.1 TonB-dependent receptor [Campylobacter curvus 525.92]